MVLHHFEYTAEMCDCRYCPYYRGKRKCTASQCPCIEERIVAGAASRAEVMAETMRDIHNGAFRRRLNQFIKEREELHMNFRNEKHRLAFVEAIRKLDKKNFALMSALYLLTAEHMLRTPILPSSAEKPILQYKNCKNPARRMSVGRKPAIL